jgi:hypothetical protein
MAMNGTMRPRRTSRAVKPDGRHTGESARETTAC